MCLGMEILHLNCLLEIRILSCGAALLPFVKDDIDNGEANSHKKVFK